MLFTIKSLQDDTFYVEFDPSEMVKLLKLKIERNQGPKYSASAMKLFYGGKQLADNTPLSDYGVKKTKFILCVIKQPKKPLKRNSDDEETFWNDQEPLFDSDREQMVNHIVELGFSRIDVANALRANFDDPDRAVDFMLERNMNVSRIDIEHPVNQDFFDNPILHYQDFVPSQSSAFNSIVLPNPQNGMVFNDTSSAPFNIIDECYTNRASGSGKKPPKQLKKDTVLNELEESKLSDHLNECGSGPSQVQSNMPRILNEIDTFQLSDSNINYPLLNVSSIEDQNLSFLLDADQEAVLRLQQLGFSKQEVIEAFLVCEKNENSAADFLFSQKFE